jgi:aminopeptidase N
LLKTAEAAAKELNVPERIALVEDAWAMTRVGKYPAGIFLNAVQAMRSERERRVIEFIAGHMDYIGDSLVPEDKKSAYRAFVLAQFGPLAKELGWKAGAADTDDQKALRASLLGILGGAGDPAAIAAAQGIVQQYLQKPSSVEGTIAGPAFTVAVENGDASLYDELSKAMGSAASAAESNFYLFALAQFRQPALIKRTLDLIDQGKVRQQDYPRIFPVLLAGAGREMAWDYLKAHWNDLAEKVTTFGGRGAVSALGGFCSAPMREDVKKFFADHRAPGAERALQQSLERMNNCIEFKQLQQANMQQWLAAQGR